MNNIVLFVVAGVIFVALPVHAQECTRPVRSDGRCGARYGGASCAPGNCCSSRGRCGTSSRYCNSRSRCEKTPFPVDDQVEPIALPGHDHDQQGHDSSCSTPARDDSRCGPQFGFAGCAVNECCSENGWCGATADHCNLRSLCQQSTTQSPLRPQISPITPVSRGIRAMSSCGNGRKMVALTFDDGPMLGATETVLSMLRQRNIKATFYLTEDNSGSSGCSLIQQMVREGHMIAHHSKSHPQFNLPTTDVDREISSPLAWLAACGVDTSTVNHFRPPYGQLLPEQAYDISVNKGFIIDLWNVETHDSDDNSNDDEAFSNVQASMERIGIGNSAVVLMHDYIEAPRILANPRNNALKRIIDYYIGLNYRFVRMDECYAQCQADRCFGNGGPTHYANVFDPDPNGVGTFPAE